MPSPFPGMDPYLEDPDQWPGVHHLLIGAFAELLNRHIRPRYVAQIEQRVYLAPDDDPDSPQERVPDLRIGRRGGKAKPEPAGETEPVAVVEPLVMATVREAERRERRVEVRSVKSRKLVAVIELLSPANKATGSEGWRSFQDKRREVIGSDAHWVEIDLLRHGAVSSYRKKAGPHEYAAHVSPASMRPLGRVWPIRLRDRLPTIGIPLRKPDPDAPLDLQNALELAYDRGALDLTVDYTRPPVPPLPADLAAWADDLLRQKRLR